MIAMVAGSALSFADEEKKDVFHLITHAAALAEGDTIIIYSTANGKAMGEQVRDDNRISVKTAVAGDSIVIPQSKNDVARLVVEGSGSARAFRVINGTTGYLYCDGTDGILSTQATAGNYAKASIAIAANGNATITFAAEGSNNLLAYYLDPDAGPGGDDPTPPIVGAPRKAPVAGSNIVECFTFTDAINADAGYEPIQIYAKHPLEVATTDVNQDGRWDVADVTTLVNHLLGQNPSPCDLNACDADGNGTVDTDDIPALVNRILSE